MVPCLLLLSCECSVFVKGTLNKKRSLLIFILATTLEHPVSFCFNFHSTQPLILVLNLKEIPEIKSHLLTKKCSVKRNSQRWSFIKKFFLQISQNSQENTFVRFSFLKRSLMENFFKVYYFFFFDGYLIFIYNIC